MRYTKKVSMWPVGLVTKFGVSSPIIRDGKITGFYDGWIGGRKFPVDMAGFAVSVKFLHGRPNAKMPFKAGYEEDGFLKSLAPLNLTEIELLASNCTEVVHTHIYIVFVMLCNETYIIFLFADFNVAHANEEELKCCGVEHDITWWYEFSDVEQIFSACVKCIWMYKIRCVWIGNVEEARKNLLWRKCLTKA